MKVMLYPNKSKFYNFLKATPEVGELPSINNTEFWKMNGDCKLSF